MFKNALVSCTNKTGLVEFLKPFVAKGLRVVSTGGTAEHLKQNGISVTEVFEQTGFPEVMDGRVRTLHPKIHMALLARAGVSGDETLLKDNGISPFDLVVGNLYDFENYVGKGLTDSELIEHIDIGGPSFLRSAAKNFFRIAVVVDPADYRWISEKRELTEADRKQLAVKVFETTSKYDQMIAKELGRGGLERETSFESELFLRAELKQPLRYGENPSQKAAWYIEPSKTSLGLHRSQVLQGKELSYNNLLDLESAIGCVRQFQQPTSVIVKHNNPCGVASDSNLASSVKRALASDPISAFGGIVAVNRPMEGAEAMALSEVFLECIVAPDFTKEALDVFSKKKNLRILQYAALTSAVPCREIRSITGGLLVQEPMPFIDWKPEWQVYGGTLTDTVKADLVFAARVCAQLKSNAIVIAAGLQTLGLGMGQVNRVDAVKHAVDRMSRQKIPSTGVVLASDAFFPFADSIEVAHEAGIKWCIQPGGAMKDQEVLEKAAQLGVGIVMTGERHFRH